jgi:hypothetical protein
MALSLAAHSPEPSGSARIENLNNNQPFRVAHPGPAARSECMQMIPANRIEKTLKQRLGFRRVKGNATGHDTFMDDKGRTCHPVLRHKDIGIASVYSLGLELASKGILESRRDFMSLLRAG